MAETNSIVILIGGGHSAGKRTVSDKLKEGIKKQIEAEIKQIELEEYVTDERKERRGPHRYDFQNVKADLKSIQETSNSARQVIIITGLYALYDPQLRALASMKVFVDCDADTRLNRWIMKDVVNGNAKLEDILDYYLRQARPDFNRYIQPTTEVADVILPSEDDALAIELICDGVVPSLRNRRNATRALYPRFGGDHALNVVSENFDGEKNRFYDLS